MTPEPCQIKVITKKRDFQRVVRLKNDNSLGMGFFRKLKTSMSSSVLARLLIFKDTRLVRALVFKPISELEKRMKIRQVKTP